MLAEIDQSEFLREIVLDELPRRLRDQHLAAVPCCGDAGAPVDVHPDVAFFGSQRFARVDAHPRANRA
jgi:2-hydroxychromene-2-carboxylate isomerase